MQDLKRSFHYFVGICLLIVTFFAFIQVYTVLLINENREGLIFIDNFYENGEKDDLGFRRLEIDSKKEYEFEAIITQEELEVLDTEIYHFIIYRLSCLEFEMYFNDSLIGRAGSENSPSNMWNSAFSFPVERSSVKLENNLKIKLRGEAEIGLFSFPIIVSTTRFNNRVMNWFNGFIDKFNSITIGIIISAFFILVFVYSLRNNLGKEYLYFSVAILLMGLAILDYMTIFSLPISIFTFKRIVMTANCLSAFFISMAFYMRFNKKMNYIFGFVLLIVTAFTLIYYRELITYKRSWPMLNTFVLINMVSWIISAGDYYKKSYEARIMLYAVLFSLYDVIVILVLNNFVVDMSIAVTRFLILPVAAIILVVFDYLELEKQISCEKTKSELMYQKSIKDEMTGVYNHQYIVSRLEECISNYSVMMIDVDNFKQINDNLGHQTGDLVIQLIAEKLKSNTRNNDTVGRYGGDEFTIISATDNEFGVMKLAERIQGNIQREHTLSNGVTLSISLSIGICTSKMGENSEEILRKADEALYESKNNGKGRISIYE